VLPGTGVVPVVVGVTGVTGGVLLNGVVVAVLGVGAGTVVVPVVVPDAGAVVIGVGVSASTSTLEVSSPTMSISKAGLSTAFPPGSVAVAVT
jgi:hypothetical protein